MMKVILIMTDTQRQDLLGCYGQKGITPNLDRLAAQGMKFTKAYTCQPVCAPARAALFTGTYPHTNGCFATNIALSRIAKTVGVRLSAGGIRAAYIGKWHLDGTDYFGSGECPEGFDPEYFYDMRNYLEELSEKDRVRSRKQETVYDPDFDESFTYAYRCSSRAIQFIESHSKEDYFLTVSYDEPHGPHLAPLEYHKDYPIPENANVNDPLDDKPEHIKVWAEKSRQEDPVKRKTKTQAYLACNTFADAQIGRVLAAIEAYAPDAVVFYTSDHGDALGSHRITGKGPAMYEEIAKIPFIIKFRGVLQPGSSYDHVVSHIDFLPTVLDLFGMEIPKTLEGRSLKPLFEHPDAIIHDEVFIEFTRFEIDHDGFGGFQPIRAAVTDRFKLVINLMTTDELYDLANDPLELHNLIGEEAFQNIRDYLHDQILNWMNETRDPFRGYYWEMRPWRKGFKPSWDYTGMTRQRENEPGEPRQLDYETGLEMKESVRKK